MILLFKIDYVEAILMSTHNMFLWRNNENYP